jgi:DNA adenine methylase
MASLIKSPLRYPGGKSRAVKEIWKYIEPLGVKTLCSPFFGGGSLEIYCAQKGIKVIGYDYFQPLVDFWKWLLEDSEKLANSVEEYRPLKSKEVFYDLQKNHVNTTDTFESAVEFYVLNRTSFSGSTLSGGMSNYKGNINPRFTESSVDRIRNFKIENLTVEFADFKESITKHPNDLLYLDPPYLVESKLYGNRGNLHKGFDHKGLIKILRKRKHWILSYNDSDAIQEMYDGFQFEYPEWTYGMSKDKKSREILILSNDILIPN